MTSALVAMVTGWPKVVSWRCARAELDLDMLTSLRSVVTVAQSTHFVTPACAGHCNQQ